MGLGISIGLGPLRYYQRLTPRRRRRHGSGALGGMIRATALLLVWTVKLCILVYGLLFAFLVYFYLGLAWLLAPLPAVIAAKLRGDQVPETVSRYQGKVARWIRSFHQGVIRALRGLS